MRAFFTVFVVCFSIVMVTAIAPSVAQTKKSKPQLVEIVLDDKTNDPRAVKIIEKFYNDWIKETKFNGKVGDIKARFLPLAQNGTDDLFVYGVLYDAPLGGCFSKGCRTVIFHKSKKGWVGVFNAFIHRAYYDKTSTNKRPANLIFSSHPDNKNPGVWMWNGIGYNIVNKNW